METVRRHGVRLELTPWELDRLIEMLHQGSQCIDDKELALKLYQAQHRSIIKASEIKG
jgi:hypothetical protein